MTDQATLQLNAGVRLKDAQVLFLHGQIDGAAYLCGYAIEFALKARICATLNTRSYPDNLRDYKTHDLERLLFLTGQEASIKQNALADWTFIVQNWKPEMRYTASGSVLPSDVRTLIHASQALLQLL